MKLSVPRQTFQPTVLKKLRQTALIIWLQKPVRYTSKKCTVKCTHSKTKYSLNFLNINPTTTKQQILHLFQVQFQNWHGYIYSTLWYHVFAKKLFSLQKSNRQVGIRRNFANTPELLREISILLIHMKIDRQGFTFRMETRGGH